MPRLGEVTPLEFTLEKGLSNSRQSPSYTIHTISKRLVQLAVETGYSSKDNEQKNETKLFRSSMDLKSHARFGRGGVMNDLP
ncbi:hypothetical protein AVEN_202844-1 [Araneus ventricosus]|uniref:Uncharacterized protein n=1 Tax=Araneus ventricosus TaxID=182803 RepID=A0A4Y2DNC9_ARAVE|nr:hypothetical protein AVEN_202844-1 [Araneus ventricosus]